MLSLEVPVKDKQRALLDWNLGRRVRIRWQRIIVLGKKYSLTEDQIRGFVLDGGLFAADADRKEIATNLGFDWDAAAEFFATIAPIIIEMMAACGL